MPEIVLTLTPLVIECEQREADGICDDLEATITNYLDREKILRANVEIAWDLKR